MEKTSGSGSPTSYPHTGRGEDTEAGRFGVLALGTALMKNPNQVPNMVDRPDKDASAAEIARWIEEDFGEALAEGIEEATDDDEDVTTLAERLDALV